MKVNTATGPLIKQNGKNISFYEQNNFGGYKSYHVFGKYTDFFGGYWHDDDFGMARYSTHDDKARKKNMDMGFIAAGNDMGKIINRYRWSICRSAKRKIV